MYSKKGKRKINVNGKIYYWCVKEDWENHLEPYTLCVFSESELLCRWGFCAPPEKWVRAPEPNPFNTRYAADGSPQITPSIVREKIIEYLKKGT